MSPKHIYVVIGILSLWIYGGVTIMETRLFDLSMPLYALLLLVALVGAYAFLTVRETKTTAKAFRKILNNDYEQVYVGDHSAVIPDKNGIVILELTANKQSTRVSAKIAYDDLSIEVLPGTNIHSDRGVGMIIRRKNTNWHYPVGLIDIQTAERMSVAGYIISRFKKSKIDGSQIAQALSGKGSVPTITFNPDSYNISLTNAEDLTQEDGRWMFWKVVGATIGGITLAVILSIATIATIGDEQSRAEFTAPFTTCARDAPKVITKQIDKQLQTSQGLITVHSLITNVAQKSKTPQAYSYKCQKATLMEISIDRTNVDTPEKNDETLRLWNISLVTAEEALGITAEDLDAASEFSSYAENNDLDEFDSRRFTQFGSERGWIAFSMPDSESGAEKSLLYDKYDENKRLDLTVKNN
ncbi:MAG: hypothetical protein V4678_01615 [Patescibacteria group bacterium]